MSVSIIKVIKGKDDDGMWYTIVYLNGVQNDIAGPFDLESDADRMCEAMHNKLTMFGAEEIKKQ